MDALVDLLNRRLAGPGGRNTTVTIRGIVHLAA
jgi:hypothetical protein